MEKTFKYKDLLVPYNPWWTGGEFETTAFHRPVFEKIYSGLKDIPQIISIVGPRRVGKSTLIRQCIRKLIEEGVASESIIYYSMDDPALFRSDVDHDMFFGALMDAAGEDAKKHKTIIYIFLDEVQRFEKWELFLKKYYDFKYPVRFVISGSASSPIFRKSRESLLGRIKEYHIPPFSFREFLLFESRENPSVRGSLEEIHKTGQAISGMLPKHPGYAGIEKVNVPEISVELRGYIDGELNRYLLEGGFPEVWSLPNWEEKQSYLFTNHVEKVITEDLVLAVELRKPEALKRFYISLLETPGVEINFEELHKKLGIARQSLEKYFPMLEMTDLVHHVERFSKKALKVKRGHIKCYLTDLALRNAVLRLQWTLLTDNQALGLYAENLVFNALRRWEGVIGIDYYREKDAEVDFVVHAAAGRYLPVEVKYRESIEARDIRALVSFARRHKTIGFVVTKKWSDFGWKDPLLYFPLAHFLLLFD